MSKCNKPALFSKEYLPAHADHNAKITAGLYPVLFR